MQAPCSLHARAALGVPACLGPQARQMGLMAQRRAVVTSAVQSRGQSYHVEIEVSEDEDPEGVYKRFRNSCNLSGMVYEARRRKFFENPQDIKKRKQQEKGMRKMRDVRERYLMTYNDAHTEAPPFSELFVEDEDIYNVLESSFDEGADVGKPIPQPLNGRRGGGGNGSVTLRSVPSLGPQAQAQGRKAGGGSGKPKAQVNTARTRRAAANKKKTGAPGPRK